MSADQTVIVLTTWPASGDPSPMAEALVEERLAACVSVSGEIRSTYRWQDRLEQADERQVIIKTVAGRVDALKARLASLHPYDVPECLVIETSGGSDAYLDWVRQSTLA